MHRLLTSTLAALSILSLLKDTFEFSFSYALERVITYYDALSRIMLGWLAPSLYYIAEVLSEILSVPLSFGEHWRHVFILLGLYFLRDTFQFAKNGDLVGFIVTLPLALIAGITSSIVVASVPLASNDFHLNLLVALTPLWCLAIYRLLRSIWASIKYCEEQSKLYDFARRVYFSWLDIGFGIVAILHFLIAFRVDALYGAQLIVIGSWILAFALWHIFKGWQRSKYPNLLIGEEFQRFWAHGNTKLGVEIISIYLGVVLVVLANAGLTRFGL